MTTYSEAATVVGTINKNWAMTNYGDGYAWLKGPNGGPKIASGPQKEKDGKLEKGCLAFLGNLKGKDEVVKVGTQIAGNQAGCCTTCSFGTAFLLMKEQKLDSKARVEIVAQGGGGSGIDSGHTFIIVGREGTSSIQGAGVKKSRRIDNAHGTWGDDAFVVDTWLGILGNPGIYEKVAAKGPHHKFIDFAGLDVHFDSKAD
ncbi:MAG: hypothetical protein HKM95_03015 [Inquilinus sp.]|nr:hypothetical protein [Inquilinus sp.]